MTTHYTNLLRWATCLLFCAGLASACAHDSTPLIDPNAPDEMLFQQALAAYDAQNYTEAQGLFDQLLVDYPDSPRHDNAGYLSGRCSLT